MNTAAYQIITQAFGIIATVIVVISFQIKTPRGTFLLMSGSFVCFAIHFAMLGSVAGAINNTLSLIRNILILTLKKDSLADKIAKIGVCFALAAVPLVELLIPALPFSPWDFLVAFATLVGSIFFWESDAKKLRIAQFFIISPCWLTYNIIVGSIPGAVTECFNLCSVAVSWVRLYSKHGADKSVDESNDGDDNTDKKKMS